MEELEIVGCPQTLPSGEICAAPAEVVCRYDELAGRALVRQAILHCVKGHEYRGPVADLADV
jgi:hypothetical protein